MFRRRGGPGCSARRLGRLRARRGDRVESKAVIDGTSLSGTMLQDRLPSAPHIKGAPQPGGQKSASWPTVLTLTALDWPAIILRQRKG